MPRFGDAIETETDRRMPSSRTERFFKRRFRRGQAQHHRRKFETMCQAIEQLRDCGVPDKNLAPLRRHARRRWERAAAFERDARNI